MDDNTSSNSFDTLLSNVIKVPGVKVNRQEFLVGEYSKYISNDDIPILLNQGPIAVGLNKNKVDKIARKLIDKRVLLSSSASFLAGLPGGIAMAATIPADIMQFFGVAIRLAQELAYIYGFDDIWEDNDDEAVKNQLTLYLGSMFGVTGASEAIRVVSSRLSTQALKQLPKQALTKGFIYPIIKQIAKFLGVKMTKDIFAKGVSKAIPIVGGVISGGITFASMKPMGNRLRETLSKSVFSYTEKDYVIDMDNLNKTVNSTDVEFENVDESNDSDLNNSDIETINSAVKINTSPIETTNSSTEKNITTSSSDSTANENTSSKESITDALIVRLKEIKVLLDDGIITESEFKLLKENLLNINIDK